MNGFNERKLKEINTEDMTLVSSMVARALLRAQYEQSTQILTHSFTAQQHANECSPRVARIFGQYKKPFPDGGLSGSASFF